MARLATVGFETQHLGTAALNCGERQSVSIPNASPTIDTTVPRSGAACAKTPASASSYVQIGLTVVTGRTFWGRCAVRFSSVGPTEAFPFIRFTDATGTIFELSLEKSGKVWSWVALDAAHAGLESPVLEKDKWYVVEAFINVPAAGKGKCGWRILDDAGKLFHEGGERESTLRNLGINTFRAGHQAAAESAVNVYLDDMAVNDDQGENQNTWCGNGKIVMLKPVADKARTGWTAGAGAVVKLFDALDNRPPVGKKLAEATDTSQIKDANNNATDTVELELAAYATPVESGGGGIGGGDTIKVMAPIVRAGQNTTTARGIGVTGVSNPAIAESAQGLAAAIAETDPTGWVTASVVFTYNPSVEKGVKPVLKIRKTVTTTDSIMADLAGLYVEYVPAAGVGLGESSGTSSASIQVTAPTVVALNPSSGESSASLELKAATTVPLQPATGESSASLAVTAPTAVPLGAASGVASASMALAAPTTVPLGASSGVATASASVQAGPIVALGASSGVASASLGLKAATTIVLAASSGVASASLSVHAPTVVPLGASSGVATATMALAPFGQKVTLGASSGAATTSLSVHAGPRLALAPSSGTSSASIVIYYPIPAAYSVRRGGVWVPL